ncbi:hypothetical protein [Klebsiella variicola]|uniref:hypothetical protein n=1 Tax=Klebsiella variicola TaxID=244366 RepID=UPI002181A583|nr:hypothetical protein [Klebsiella variicola]GKO12652.1 hypothetical protein NUKP99_46760 [Klebsiella variicola]HCI9332754.1 hypothetical protein [Klebsiella variicola]
MNKKYTLVATPLLVISGFSQADWLDNALDDMSLSPQTTVQNDDFEGASRRVDFISSSNKQPYINGVKDDERLRFQIGSVFKKGGSLTKKDFEFPTKLGEVGFYRDHGQFFCNNSLGKGCDLKIKFGDEQPFTIRTLHADDVSDNHSLIIAPTDAKKIVDKISEYVDDEKLPNEKKMMKVIYPTYGLGKQEFIFDVGMFYCLPYSRQCK